MAKEAFSFASNRSHHRLPPAPSLDDRAGSLFDRVGSVYGNYVSSLNTPDMQAVQSRMAPVLSRHRSKCYNVPGLFDKIERMHAAKDGMLERGEWDAEMARLAERVYVGFVRMGAKLDEASKKEYADIQGEWSVLISGMRRCPFPVATM